MPATLFYSVLIYCLYFYADFSFYMAISSYSSWWVCMALWRLCTVYLTSVNSLSLPETCVVCHLTLSSSVAIFFLASSSSALWFYADLHCFRNLLMSSSCSDILSRKDWFSAMSWSILVFCSDMRSLLLSRSWSASWIFYYMLSLSTSWLSIWLFSFWLWLLKFDISLLSFCNFWS
jgi:hypothetical protein